MSTALTTYEGPGMVTPLANAQDAKAAIQQYEALKVAIQQPTDVHIYQGRPFLKKAFWRRIAACFGLSLELVSEQRETDEGGKLAYSVFYRAIAPNGRTMMGDGFCSRSEKGHEGWPEHTVRATAHTRAKNRAISDMVGGGEVSADELGDYVDEQPARPAARQPQRPTQPTSASPSDDLSIGEFVREAAKLGLNSKQITERLGVEPAQFHAINRRAALEKLAGVVESAPETEPVEIAFVEEDHSQDASVAQDAPAEAWNALADVEFRKLCNQAGLKSIAGVEGFLHAQFGEGPISKTDATEAIRAAMVANGRTPDLATLPARAVH